MDMIEFKLTDTRDQWDKAHYINSKQEQNHLTKMLKVLDDIKALEDNMNLDSDIKIDQKYQEFGRLLFDIQDIKRFNEKHEVENIVKTSWIRMLWD
jgi:hypothetical protein